MHDIARNRFVLYGGWTSLTIAGTASNQTWEFDGATWTQVTTAMNPGPRYRYAMCHDFARARTVLFGGDDSVLGAATSAQTWEFDGASWQQIATVGSPGARERAAMCFLPAINRSVLFGGQRIAQSGSMTQVVADDSTWLYDGASWTQVPVVGSRPAPRTGASLVADSARGVVVLFGGMIPSSGLALDDTWEFDGTAWTQVLSSTSGGRDGGMAFDSVRRRVLRFGGAPTLTMYSDETWSFGASSVAFGAGCAGSNGVPVLTATDAPRLGAPHTLVLGNASAAPVAVFVLGLTGVGGVPLDGIGMPGCVAHVSPDLLLAAPSVGGASATTLAIPAQAGLLGVALFAQGLSLDVGVNVTGLVVSNGLDELLGR